MRSNISTSLDAFVGRSAEQARLDEWLAEARLVTLVGPPGAGKTRLAREQTHRPATGVTFEEAWFCDLSHAATADEMVDALAQVWGIALQGDDLATRAEALQAEAATRPRALVILDNFETVLESSALLVLAWAANLPHTFVVTSTAPLDVRGERRLAVGALGADAAAELFLERAFVEAGRAHTDDDAAVAARIAARLDGLPLAIELAARQAEVFSPPEIEAHLDTAFELLSSGPRDAPERHQSLEAMVEWGWRRLSEDERRIMRAACVFEGGFSPDAVSEVSGTPAPQARRLLLGLRRKSMLTAADSAEPASRLHLLNTLKSYASARLDEAADERRGYRLRHLAYFASKAATWLPNLNRADAEDARRELEEERANVVAALRRVVTEPGVAPSAEHFDAAMVLALALRALHDRRGVVLETATLLRELLALGEGRDDIDAGRYARLRAATGELALRAGDPSGAGEVAAAVEHARRSADDRALATTLMSHAEVLFADGARAEGVAAYVEAVEAAQRAGDPHLELDTRQSLVVARSFVGEFDIDEHEEVYRLAVQVGDAWMEATCLTNMAILLRFDGRYAEAIPRFETAAQRFAELGDDATAGQVLLFKGVAQSFVGELDEAEKTLLEAKLLLRHRGPEERHMPDLALARLKSTRGDLAGADVALTELVLKATADGAAEAAGLGQIERYYLACVRGAESAIRAELEAMPDPDTIRSFDVHQHARTLRAVAADLDEELTPAIDALSLEFDDDPGLRTFVELNRGVLLLVRSRRPGADVGALRQRIRETIAPLESEVASFKAQQHFELNRWLELLRAALGDRAATKRLLARADFSAVRPPDSDWIDLRKKGRSRAVVRALLEQRIHHPGIPLTADDLFEAAWPDTTIRHDSAMSRVYTAMSEIRKMGFADVFDRTDAGYLVPESIEVVFEEES